MNNISAMEILKIKGFLSASLGWFSALNDSTAAEEMTWAATNPRAPSINNPLKRFRRS